MELFKLVGVLFVVVGFISNGIQSQRLLRRALLPA